MWILRLQHACLEVWCLSFFYKTFCNDLVWTVGFQATIASGIRFSYCFSCLIHLQKAIEMETINRRAELIVRSAVRDGINKDRGGCEGSVLLDSTSSNTAEKDSPANKPTRDSFDLTGGISYDVQAGRRDGKVSLIAETSDLPGPTLNVDQLTQSFAKKGLSQEEMVTLSGRTGGPCCDVPAERKRRQSFSSPGNIHQLLMSTDSLIALQTRVSHKKKWLHSLE
ncbi:PEROXIDASE [Salix viminalis]|uniref:peroxidase n=1 Tax=Salix viminalis TaxID=40686 RepID=A0A9Q0SHB3_SALVM|nr:PEROXIDASE [Salix viminalis]